MLLLLLLPLLLMFLKACFSKVVTTIDFATDFAGEFATYRRPDRPPCNCPIYTAPKNYRDPFRDDCSDRPTDRPTDIQTDRQTDRPTGVHQRTQVDDSYNYPAARVPYDTYTFLRLCQYMYTALTLCGDTQGLYIAQTRPRKHALLSCRLCCSYPGTDQGSIYQYIRPDMCRS